MKRLIPDSLITFWQNNPNCHRADCFVVVLPNGMGLCATDGQWDITLKVTTPGWTEAQTTFKAVEHGVWSRGAITSEANTQCGSNTMALTCVPQPGTVYPGLALSVLSAAHNHLFDGSTVWVFTAYMPIGGYGDVSAGIETKFQGTITKVPTLARNKVEFECADPLFLLNMKIPSRLIQSNCPWSFCDANCSLDATEYTVDFAAASASTQVTLTPASAFTQAAGYFAQGVVKCLTGANAGFSQTVKAHASGVLTLVMPWVLPVVAGDTFAVIKGCDKTAATCAATTRANGTAETQDFRLRHGAMPFVPAPTSAV